MIPLPSVPRQFAYLAASVWLVLVVISALLADRHGFLAHLAGALINTAAPIAFGAAGIGLVVERWQRHELQRRTEPLVDRLARQAIDALKDLAVSLYRIPVEAVPDIRDTVLADIAPAFHLPIERAQEELFRFAIDLTREVFSALVALLDRSHERERAAKQTYQGLLNPTRRVRDPIQGGVEPDAVEGLSESEGANARPRNLDVVIEANSALADAVVDTYLRIRGDIEQELQSVGNLIQEIVTVTTTQRTAELLTKVVELRDCKQWMAKAYEQYLIDRAVPVDTGPSPSPFSTGTAALQLSASQNAQLAGARYSLEVERAIFMKADLACDLAKTCRGTLEQIRDLVHAVNAVRPADASTARPEQAVAKFSIDATLILAIQAYRRDRVTLSCRLGS